MKRGLGVISLLVLSLILLVGCGSEDASGSEESVTVGITQIVEHPSLDAATEGFKKALEDNGYVEGENIEYDEQLAQGDMNNAQTIAKNFAGDEVDMIFANATPSAQAALNATKEIPIVFTSVTDPVGAELVTSFEEPGDNITGTSDTHPDAIPQTINFIVDEIGAKSIGVIYNSGEQNSTVQVDTVKEALEGTDVELVEATVSTSAEVQQAAESLVGRADAIYVPTDNTVVSALEAVLGVAESEQIPVFAGELDSVERGALAGSGFSYEDLGYETGEMAAQILKGDKDPSEIEVSYPKNLKLVINKEAAEKMGVEIKEEWSEKAEFLGE
ncbi:ABC transporter substrate-binding protein [Thalassobacillus hwangdonensis]|uniref:ABC transporter substrate-binding protein n=1 Tax=Thalassobacillus hwangdonensis TaxID=546108 RepID=A0ABW3L1I0_9BACI